MTFSLIQLLCWLVLLTGPAGSVPAPAAQQYTRQSPHGKLDIPCENCHTAAGWKPLRTALEFDHNKTKYPLRGMHASVKCTECHTKPVFTNVGQNCADCHADIHRRKFGPNCAECHTVAGWNVTVQQVRQHDNRFPLLGAHAAVQCEECHKGAAVGQYEGLSIACASCHLRDFQNATSPSHTGSSFPTTCETCHTVDTWGGAKFDHLAVTGYALTGAHATLDCVACHVGGKYQGTPATCAGCHLSDWQKTTNPVHPAAGPDFAAANCANCHTTAGWDGANFNHAPFFALTNAHAGLQCSQCHLPGASYSAAPTTCQGCHMDKYNTAVTPINHVQLGFPPALCSSCHDTIAWTDGKFDHSTTSFPLTGTHVTTPCASCHINNNYSGTLPTDCYSCHITDWNNTQTAGGAVPNHIAAGYPTTCATCHTTTNWLGATFNHTFFPVPHHGSVCSDCHLVPSNYATFSCINCHTQTAHDQTSTNQRHQGISGYSYGPTTCYNCHKNGGGG